MLQFFNFFILCGFFNPRIPSNYGKIIRFLKVSVFSVIPTTLVWLNVVPGGHAEPTGHYGCSLGHSDRFGGSYITITQRFENSQKSVFGRRLEAHTGMKGWFARVGHTGARLCVLRAL
jgi:hypothetical protein